jgi:hypothetical protein
LGYLRSMTVQNRRVPVYRPSRGKKRARSARSVVSTGILQPDRYGKAPPPGHYVAAPAHPKASRQRLRSIRNSPAQRRRSGGRHVAARNSFHGDSGRFRPFGLREEPWRNRARSCAAASFRRRQLPAARPDACKERPSGRSSFRRSCRTTATLKTARAHSAFQRQWRRSSRKTTRRRSPA